MILKKYNHFYGLFIIISCFSFAIYVHWTNTLKNQINNIQNENIILDVTASTADKNILSTSTVQVRQSETLMHILKEKGLSHSDSSQIIQSIQRVSGNVQLKEGQEIAINIEAKGENVLLKNLKFRESPDFEIIVSPENSEKRYNAQKLKIQLKKEIRFVSGALNTTFYNALKNKGLSPKIIKTASTTLGYVINFQHDIQKGDEYKFLYEAYVDSDGKISKVGNILYMSMAAKGKIHELYGVKHGANDFNYFTKIGESVERGFLQTPLDARRIRITSNFNLKGRIHPIKGYCRAHKGVDFGATYGTPIIAAASGRVIQAGYDGDYGNKVVISHANGYKTVYAHLSKINVRRGDSIKQRQLIGKVGSTGLSTGPHLHFEVLINNRHVNPMSVKMMPTKKLLGNELRTFQATVLLTNRELEKHNIPTVVVT